MKSKDLFAHMDFKIEALTEKSSILINVVKNASQIVSEDVSELCDNHYNSDLIASLVLF